LKKIGVEDDEVEVDDGGELSEALVLPTTLHLLQAYIFTYRV
jgi:hypothetical protein